LNTESKLKICITGASGFLGLWITQVVSNKFEVFAITRSTSSTIELRKNSKIKVIAAANGDWASAVNEIAPDVLIMCDWEGVGNAQRNSANQHSNLTRIKEFINSLNPIETIIGVGSQAELGPKENEILDDEDSSPTTEYGQAKCEVRDYLIDRFQYTGTNFKWARIFSTYGALDQGSWLIPNLIKSLNKGEPFLLTEGTQEWNYLHAYDVAQGFMLLSTRGEPGIYNIGNTETITVRDTCNEIASIMKKESKLLKFGEIPMRADQVMKLHVSTSKLQALGWHPRVKLLNGLMPTVYWICNHKLVPLELDDGNKVHFS